jgi:hypothetical protein
MIIIHSHWIIEKETGAGRIALWAEQDVFLRNAKEKRKKRDGNTGSKSVPVRCGGRKEKIRVHPFCLDVSGLSKMILESLSFTKTHEKGSLILSLPSAQEIPLPSSGILNITAPQITKVTLKEWEVPCLFLSPMMAIEFFTEIGERTTLAAGIIFGQDVVFWQKVFRYVVTLVIKQQLVPSVERRGSEYISVWEPNFTSKNVQDLTYLCKAMPPILRSAAYQDNFLNSGEIVSSFVKSTVDNLARISIQQGGFPVIGKKGSKFESVHDAWIASLRSDSPEILFREAGRKQNQRKKTKKSESSLTEFPGKNILEIFLKQISEWKRPLHIASGGAFRTCFRLEEPNEEGKDDESWHLQYLLQASDDPSLIVPAVQVWQKKGKIATFLNRKFDNPQERLLSSLGRAASIFPQIGESLKTSVPDGVYLDSSEAYRFLTEASWIFEQSGFGIIVPAWWSRKGTGQKFHIRAKIKPSKMKGGAGLGLADLIRFHWEAAVGDEKLSLQELQHLAKLKSPLVKIKGQWVELNAEELKAAVSLLEYKKDNKVPLSEIVRMSFGHTEKVKGIRFEGVDAEGYVADVLDKLSGQQQVEALNTPEGFSGVLRPYQQRGYSWLNFLKSLGLGACLADDMGLGKTIQTLALFLKDKQEGQKMPVLLICPTSVVGNWQREAAKFTHA